MKKQYFVQKIKDGVRITLTHTAQEKIMNTEEYELHDHDLIEIQTKLPKLKNANP